MLIQRNTILYNMVDPAQIYTTVFNCIDMELFYTGQDNSLLLADQSRPRHVAVKSLEYIPPSPRKQCIFVVSNCEHVPRVPAKKPQVIWI